MVQYFIRTITSVPSGHNIYRLPLTASSQLASQQHPSSNSIHEAQRFLHKTTIQRHSEVRTNEIRATSESERANQQSPSIVMDSATENIIPVIRAMRRQEQSAYYCTDYLHQQQPPAFLSNGPLSCSSYAASPACREKMVQWAYKVCSFSGRFVPF